MFIDTHCHLDFPQFDHDREEVIKSAKDGGVDYIINVGSGLKSSEGSLELAQRHDFIYACVGVHPHEADTWDDKVCSAIAALAKSSRVVAIGEAGLDYFKNYSKPQNQKPLFISMINLSKETDLPLVVHSRSAEQDTLQILKSNMPKSAVVHCFSGDGDFLRECLDLGFFISFTCNVTYKKADNLRNLIKIAPIERILLETDAPYLSPEGLRGKRNSPENVKYVAVQIAQIKGIAVGEAARVTADNAKQFFNLK